MSDVGRVARARIGHCDYVPACTREGGGALHFRRGLPCPTSGIRLSAGSDVPGGIPEIRFRSEGGLFRLNRGVDTSFPLKDIQFTCQIFAEGGNTQSGLS